MMDRAIERADRVQGEHDRGRNEGMATGLNDFLDRLSTEDRDSLLGILRMSNTYLAEDMDDVLAILSDLNEDN